MITRAYSKSSNSSGFNLIFAEISRDSYIQAGRQAGRQAGMQADRQTDRQINTQHGNPKDTSRNVSYLLIFIIDIVLL